MAARLEAAARERGDWRCNAEERAAYQEAEAAFLAALDTPLGWSQHSERNLGTRCTPALLAERLLAELDCQRRSQAVARKLEAGGFPARREDGVTIIGAVSGAIVGNPRYRNINLIPAVAARKRAEQVATVDYWHQVVRKKPHPLRYLVVTSGPAVALDEAPAALDAFGRKLGDFVESARRGFDIEVVLAAIEAPCSRDANGRARVQLHANVAYDVDYVLKSRPSRCGTPGRTEWDRWLEHVRDYFGTDQVTDAGAVRKMSAVLRYVTKSNDIQQLTPAETADLARMLHRRNLVRFYGALKEWKAGLGKKGLVVRRDDPTGGLTLVRRKVKEKSEAEATKAEARKAGSQGDGTRRGRPGRAGKGGDGRTQRSPRPVENDIVFVSAPQARRSLFKEPLVGIRGYKLNYFTPEGHFGLEAFERIRDETVNKLRARGLSDEDLDAASRLVSRTLAPPTMHALADLPGPSFGRILALLGLAGEGIEPDMLEPGSRAWKRVERELTRRLGDLLDGSRHSFGPVADVPRVAPESDEHASPDPQREAGGPADPPEPRHGAAPVAAEKVATSGEAEAATCAGNEQMCGETGATCTGANGSRCPAPPRSPPIAPGMPPTTHGSTVPAAPASTCSPGVGEERTPCPAGGPTVDTQEATVGASKADAAPLPPHLVPVPACEEDDDSHQFSTYAYGEVGFLAGGWRRL